MRHQALILALAAVAALAVTGCAASAPPGEVAPAGTPAAAKAGPAPAMAVAGAVEAVPGAVEAVPGAVEAVPGAVEAVSGAVEAVPGAPPRTGGIPLAPGLEPLERAPRPGVADALAPASCRSFSLTGPLFATGSWALEPGTEAVLDQLVAELGPDRGSVWLVGHTDDRPIAIGNLALSQRRAEAVGAALVSRGVDRARLRIEGRGADEPVDPAGTEEALARNRRVEIHVSC